MAKQLLSKKNILDVLLGPAVPLPPGVVVDEESVVPGLGVGKYGKEEGPFVLYIPFESTNILSFPLWGEGGVNSKNGSPDNPNRRKYTEILQYIIQSLLMKQIILVIDFPSIFILNIKSIKTYGYVR